MGKPGIDDRVEEVGGLEKKGGNRGRRGQKKNDGSFKGFSHLITQSPSLHVGGIISLACNQDISSACKRKKKACVYVIVYVCLYAQHKPLHKLCPDRLPCILVLCY